MVAYIVIGKQKKTERNDTMSVDAIMYKAKALTVGELNRITGLNISDIDVLNDYEIRAYSAKEVSTKPTRFKEIQPFLHQVSLLCTRTDYRACLVSLGMPQETNSYSLMHMGGGSCIASFENQRIHVSNEDLEKFTETTKEQYYVFKRKSIDTEISGHIARSLMNACERAGGSESDVDLSYSPICLNQKNRKTIIENLVKLYDDEELYPSEELSKFLMELLRTETNDENEVFLEFQD